MDFNEIYAQAIAEFNSEIKSAEEKLMITLLNHSVVIDKDANEASVDEFEDEYEDNENPWVIAEKEARELAFEMAHINNRLASYNHCKKATKKGDPRISRKINSAKRDYRLYEAGLFWGSDDMPRNRKKLLEMQDKYKEYCMK